MRSMARKEWTVATNEFGSRTEDLANEAAAKASRVGDRVSDAASRAKDKAAEMGSKAAEAIESKRVAAASNLESASRTLHEKADRLPGGASVSRFAHRTADKVGSTASYLRDHEMKDMLSDVEGWVKSHPAQALVGAAVVGFFAGRAMRRG
jgi:ElaB/YqjD/DUF883 family membrane-anchored ribosome-binding protein